jgi:hypothetical protein
LEEEALSNDASSSSIGDKEEHRNEEDDSAALFSSPPAPDCDAPQPRNCFFEGRVPRSSVTPGSSNRNEAVEEEENEDTAFDFREAAGRKRRVEIENAELSRQLSKVLNDFLKRPNISSRRSVPSVKP